MQRQASDLVGSIYLRWMTPDERYCTIYRVEVEPGWQLEDVSRHIERLFGQHIKQGQGRGR